MRDKGVPGGTWYNFPLQFLYSLLLSCYQLEFHLLVAHLFPVSICLNNAFDLEKLLQRWSVILQFMAFFTLKSVCWDTYIIYFFYITTSPAVLRVTGRHWNHLLYEKKGWRIFLKKEANAKVPDTFVESFAQQEPPKLVAKKDWKWQTSNIKRSPELIFIQTISLSGYKKIMSINVHFV